MISPHHYALPPNVIVLLKKTLRCLRLAGLAAATVLVAPLALLAHVDQLLPRGEPFFSLGGQLLALMPGFIGNLLRSAYYWLTTESFHPTATLCHGSYFSTRRVFVEPGVWIGAYCIIGRARIGEATMVASRVSILSGRHQHGNSGDSGAVAGRRGSIVRVSIGRHTWVGESALIAADVGDNAIVGAGAVVVREVPSLTTVVGNPARPIHHRRQHD